jgi:ABC-type phosphate transport system permease subunit
MATMTEKLTGRGKRAARRAYKKVEERVLVAQGRKAVRTKVETIRKVTRKAVKTGILTGSLAALGVVVGAVRKARRDRY